jgi:DNA-binding beta-propeller fold protein YncE
MPRTLPSMVTVLVLATPSWGQPPNRSEVTALLFLPDGKTAIAACLDDKLHVYDTATAKETLAIEAHKDGVWAVALSSDGKLLATAGGDHLVRLWDAGKLKEIRRYEGQTKEVLAVAFSPDGKTLASGGADGSIRTWDVASAKLKSSWQAHELKVLSVVYGADDKTLTSGGTCTAVVPGFARGAIQSDFVRLWNPQTGKELRKHLLRGSSVSYSPDGRTLLAAGNYISSRMIDNGVNVRGSGTSVALGSVLKDLEWAEMRGVGSMAAFSPDGRLVALAYGNRLHVGTSGRYRFENEMKHRRISVWEAATGQEILQIPEEEACEVAISPDGKKLMVGSGYMHVQFFDLKPEGWTYGDKAPKLEAKDLERLWGNLSGAEAGPAYLAVWTLAAAGEPAVTFLKEKLQPEKAVGDQVPKLLAKLDSDTYAVRDGAARDLKKLGSAIEGELRVALEGKVSSEVRKRLEKLLEPWEKRPASPEELRVVRALQVLEQVGSVEARAVLRRMADGAPGSWLTVQAQLAVKRLGRR